MKVDDWPRFLLAMFGLFVLYAACIALIIWGIIL